MELMAKEAMGGNTHSGSDVGRADVAYVFDTSFGGPDGRLLLDETHYDAVMCSVAGSAVLSQRRSERDWSGEKLLVWSPCLG